MTVGELLVILAGYDPDVVVFVEGNGRATTVDWMVDFKNEESRYAIIINDYPTNV